MSIAVDPSFLALTKKPLSSNNGQTIERKTHRLPNTQQPVNGSNFRQDMRGVGPLLAAFLEPATLFEERQHGIQQHLFGSPLNQAFAKVREQGKVKPWIGQFQPQCILPIDAPSHRISRL